VIFRLGFSDEGFQSRDLMLTYLFDRYELDEENLTLTRDGQRVPLEPKALSVLLLMVRSPGKLLKKDAILAAVWKNTIVEESSLSRAVTLLRKQLGDDPRNPTFIETVPTLGYRFIAKIDVPKPVPMSNASSVNRGPELAEPTAAAPAPAPATTPTSAPIAEPPPPFVTAPTPAPISTPAPAFAPTPAPARGDWTKYAWISAALLVLLAAVITYRLAIRPQPTVLREKPIVLADFANLTGELVFDGTLRQGMLAQLEQSPLFSLVAVFGNDLRLDSLNHERGRVVATGFCHALVHQMMCNIGSRGGGLRRAQHFSDALIVGAVHQAVRAEQKNVTWLIGHRAHLRVHKLVASTESFLKHVATRMIAGLALVGQKYIHMTKHIVQSAFPPVVRIIICVERDCEFFGFQILKEFRHFGPQRFLQVVRREMKVARVGEVIEIEIIPRQLRNGSCVRENVAPLFVIQDHGQAGCGRT